LRTEKKECGQSMTILVTGATGSVGRLVVDHLLAAGATDVRALTNKPDKAALPAGVEVVKGYIGRPETLPAALEGVDRMYLAPLQECGTSSIWLDRKATGGTTSRWPSKSPAYRGRISTPGSSWRTA
jgi:nucleoside-diphosphate-sugar epimerase